MSQKKAVEESPGKSQYNKIFLQGKWYFKSNLVTFNLFSGKSKQYLLRKEENNFQMQWIIFQKLAVKYQAAFLPGHYLLQSQS